MSRQPKTIFNFPIQAWNPGDPVIRDGIDQVLGGALSQMIPYGGFESYRDTAYAEQLAQNHAVLLVAGTPAFWDPGDRDIYRAAMDRQLPIVIWGIGSGGSDRPWDGLNQERDLLERLATYPHLQLLALRDETTHQVFRHAGASIAQILPCPGLFGFPAARLRTEKKRVALDILDPATLEKDGLYDAWTYYGQIQRLIEALADRGAELHLGCQRAIRDHGSDLPFLNRAATWLDGTGRSLIEWLIDAGVAENLVFSLADFPDRDVLHAHYSACDVYIGGRIHGALPATGSGMPSLGMGIDLRRHTWLPAASVLAIAPFQPPLIDLDFILDWYDRLDPEPVSAAAIRFRAQVMRRTRHLLRQTDLAPFVPTDHHIERIPVGHARGGAGVQDDVLSAPISRETLLAAGAMPRPRPVDLGPIFHPSDRVHFQGSQHFAEARVYNWYHGYGQALRPTQILEIGVRRGYGAYSLIKGAGGTVRSYYGLDMELDIPGSNGVAEAMIRRLGVPDVNLVTANSQTDFPALAAQFDLIHIDGDHSTRGALQDVIHCLPLLAENGTIILDDVESRPVRLAANLIREALGATVCAVERGDWHRQLIIAAKARAAHLTMEALLARAPPALAAGLLFDEARVTLRALVGQAPEVPDVAACFARVASATARILALEDVFGGVPSLTSAGNVFTAFAVLIELGSDLADARGLRSKPFLHEAMEHGVYALGHLAGFEPPRLFAPVERPASALQPGAPGYAGILLEASMNFTEILLRMQQLLAADGDV